MTRPPQPAPRRESDPAPALYAGLMACGRDTPTRRLLARMLVSRRLDRGALPARLGLGAEAFGRMMAGCFPGAGPATDWAAGPPVDASREPERAELRGLLLAHAADAGEACAWMAEVVAAGCMGGDHLWQDLGLWSRRDLSELFLVHFPALAAKNDRDMKWKKFLYKQLCAAEGIYVCRSPSCEVCPDYKDCFGPED